MRTKGLRKAKAEFGEWFPFSSAVVFWRDFGFHPQKKSKIQNSNIGLGQLYHIYLTSVYLKLAGVHPRHPPRALPLWLLAPRCLSAGNTERLKYRENEPFGISPRLLGRRSFLSPGSGYTQTRSLSRIFFC